MDFCGIRRVSVVCFHTLMIPICLLLGAIETSAESTSCGRWFSELDRGIEELSLGVLSPSDQIAINVIFNSKRETREKARMAFEITFEARIRDLPPDDQAAMRTALAKAKIENAKYFNGVALPLIPNSVRVFRPPEYVESFLEFSMLLHELEHQLQGRRIGLYRGVLSRLLRPIEMRYRLENGAMRAEWTYLHSLPEWAKDELVEAIQADAALKGWEKETVVRMLQASHLPQSKYISVMEESYRYSRFAIGVSHSLAVGGLAGSSLIAGYVFVKICESQKTREAPLMNSGALVEFCKLWYPF